MLSEELPVEKVLKLRYKNGKERVLVRWMGYGAEHDTWEPVESLIHCCADEILALRRKRQEKKDRLEAMRLSQASNRQTRSSATVAAEKRGQRQRTAPDFFQAGPASGKISRRRKMPSSTLSCLHPRMRFKKGAKKQARNIIRHREARVVDKQTVSSMKEAWNDLMRIQQSDRVGNPAHMPSFLLKRAMECI